MGVKLKPLDEQVVVVTGASSGIGLVTARMAAERGAAVVLAARGERALESAVRDIEAAGGRATYVVADVADEDDVRRIADAAVDELGGVDTWVNNAAVGMYGRLDEITDADHRRLFDVNYFGCVYGSRVALEVLCEDGGALINVGSALSDRAIPLQGAYAASKHAVKAFTDALRMEVEEAGLPVSVSLVKPATISTPYYEHARNYMDRAPKMVPPVYAPEVVARAILACAVHPRRDVFAGGAGKGLSAAEHWALRAADRVMERTMFDGQRADRAPYDDDNLYAPAEHEGAERNADEGVVFEHSAYTAATTRPGRVTALALGLGVAAAAAMQLVRARQQGGVDVGGPDSSGAGRGGRGPGWAGSALRRRDATGGRSGGVPDSAEADLYTPGG